MTKILHCRDAGFDCATVVRGDTTDDVLAQVSPHAQQVHGVEVTPDLTRQLETLITDE